MGWSLVAEAAGGASIAGHETQVMGLGASTVLDCWEVPKASRTGKQPAKNTAKAAFEAGTVDVLSLSALWLPDEGIEKFVGLGRAHNPKMRVTVLEFWLPNDEYRPIYPLETKRYQMWTTIPS